MNETLKVIMTRRSVRNFSEKRIKREDLDAILDAAIYAPSGMNRQTWQFTAITDREKIKELASMIERKMDREGYDFYQPDVLVISSNERDSKWGPEDNACGLENIFLSAWSLGIGSVWINQIRDICDDPEVREMLRQWGVPDGHAVYGAAALGYPAEDPPVQVEKTGAIKVI